MNDFLALNDALSHSYQVGQFPVVSQQKSLQEYQGCLPPRSDCVSCQTRVEDPGQMSLEGMHHRADLVAQGTPSRHCRSLRHCSLACGNRPFPVTLDPPVTAA